MNELKSIEVATVTQALVVGQVVDSISGNAVNDFEFDVSVRYFVADDFRPLHALKRKGEKGYFSLAGSPTLILPEELGAGASPQIRIEISADGYASSSLDVDLEISDVAPEETDVTLAGNSYSLPVISAPLVNQRFELQPFAVGLQGTVIEHGDPESRLPGASVQVVAPVAGTAVVTNDTGYYRIDSLPIAPSVTVQVELEAVVTTVIHIIDYSKPLNTRNVSLNG